MPVVIRRVVSQRSECKRELVYVLRIVQQRDHEITAARVVDQVAEELAPERVVAHILNNGAPISIGMRFNQLVRSSIGEMLQQERLQLVLPRRIDDGFVCE